MQLEWINVTGTSKSVPLSHITFSLDTGYILVLVGKNGAGKTTLLRTMMKEEKQYTGQIMLNGMDIHENHTICLERMAYIADEAKFFTSYTAKQNAELLMNCFQGFKMKKFEEWMKRMELPMGKVVGTMSRGEYIKFQMAFAIAHSPRLYLIDEATAGMDTVFYKEFHRILRELLTDEKVSIIMTTHNEEEVYRMADYIGLLEDGHLVSIKENV